MFIFMILLITVRPSLSSRDNTGTVLFYNKNGEGECWTEDDVAKLRARRTFEELMPPKLPLEGINTYSIKSSLRYFRRALKLTEKDVHSHTSKILKEALADAIGSHLKSNMLPTTRFAYYAGYVTYRSARQLEDLYEELKKYLNTQGLGWKKSNIMPRWSNVTVSKILVGTGSVFDPCACLVVKRDENSCIRIPLPKFDDSKIPTAIALPFKSAGLLSLSSDNAENALLKYYTTSSRCILKNSPEKCRHEDFVNFNTELWHWMKRDVAPHLGDETLYAPYGGILRIAAAVQRYGKGLSRRNLFEYDEGIKWHPWQALSQSNVCSVTDWTPLVYIGIVFLVALIIYTMQICYNYTFGNARTCCGLGQAKNPRDKKSKDVAYTTIESNIPAILPQQNMVYYNEKSHNGHSESQIKKQSAGSIKTQKVYDLNENTEKNMEVIMSDDESQAEQTTSEDNCVTDVGRVTKVPKDSPPELKTSISEVTIDKTKLVPKDRQDYSTSTLSRSDVTYCQTLKQSRSWSETSRTSSSSSVSSVTSLSRRSKIRSSRDLAWARRIISKHSYRNQESTSQTELDMNSFTTPPSRTSRR